MTSPHLHFKINPNSAAAKMASPERLTELEYLNAQIFKGMVYSIWKRVFTHQAVSKTVFGKLGYKVQCGQHLQALDEAYCGIVMIKPENQSECQLTISLMDNALSDVFDVFKLKVTLKAGNEGLLHQITDIDIEADLENTFYHKVPSQRYILKLIDWISRTLNHYYYTGIPEAIYEAALYDEAHQVEDHVGVWYNLTDTTNPTVGCPSLPPL